MGGLIPPRFEGASHPPIPPQEKAFDISRAHAKALAVAEQNAIDPRKLGKPYNTQDVGKDIQYAKDKKRELERKGSEEEKRSKPLSDILEIAIYEQINSGWFGSNVRASLPSTFDDLINKVDLIAEIQIPESRTTAPVAMGIDITYAQALKRKISWIMEEIDAGSLATVKYYQSKNGRDVGPLEKIPHLLIGVDETSAMVIAKAWYEENPALKKDPLRDQVLIELIDQCEAFSSYALSRGKEEASKAYLSAKRLFENIYGKGVTPQDRNKFSSDRVFKALELQINQLKSAPTH